MPPTKQPSADMILKRLTQLHPKIIDLSLDRVEKLLQKLGNPQKKIPPVIHIAGTNGKGSTLSLIKSSLEASDKKVHAYISPHLVKFHERITLAGKLISDVDLCNYLTTCEKYNCNEDITFFEITTCAAFLAYSQTKADYTLLEVGLGGRLDATNTIESPQLCVITPISIDHEHFLGNTLQEISHEKAGILKKNVTAIVGKQDKRALKIIRNKASEIGAVLQVYGEDWFIKEIDGKLIFNNMYGKFTFPAPNLRGKHQIENAGMAISALQHLKIGEKEISVGLRNVNWPARLQLLKEGPLVELVKAQCNNSELWLDGGHNVAAGQKISETIRFLENRPIHLICGMMNNKDIFGFLKPFSKTISSLYGVKIPGQPQSFSQKKICETGKLLKIESYTAQSTKMALSTILNSPNKETPLRILICGSLYLAGYILSENS